MPSRGFYEVANTEEGKVIQRDQSYRSCVLTLIIFLFLCIILIVVGLLLRKSHSYNEDKDSGSVEGYHHRHYKNRTRGTTTGTTESSQYSTDATVSGETNEKQTTLKTTTTVIDATSWTDTSRIFERLKDAEPETSTFSVATTELVINKDASTSSTTTTELKTTEEKETFPVTTESFTNAEETSTSTNTELITTKEKEAFPITTESVTNAGETSTNTEHETDEEKMTESVTNVEETSTSINTEFETGEEKIVTSPITTESVINAEETSTLTTTELETDEKKILISSITTESVTNAEETSTSTNSEFETGEEKIVTSPITTKSVTNAEETSTSATTEFETAEEKILTSLITTESVINAEETSTTTESGAKDEETSTSSTTTESMANKEDEVSTVETSSISTTTADAITASTTGSEEETTISSTTDRSESETAHSTLSTEQSRISTSSYENEPEVCDSGDCKNLASRMLFYMNHMADPCEDFYEYACGGFEANPRVGEMSSESATYNRILRQLRQEIREGKSSLFTRYYDSCMRYETLILKEKISAARGALDSVGKFYTTDNFDKANANFTVLVARLLLHNSALLFDVSPEIDEDNPIHFTLKIGPTKYKSPFEIDGTEDDPCYASQFERDQETVDLKKLYEEYKSCKNNTKEFLSSIKEALSALGVFQELRNEYNISQYVDTTVINIDLEIVQKFFANFPSKDQIREAYLMKKYSNVSITELQTNRKIINWSYLVKLLTEYDIVPGAYVQVYFYDALTKGLENLEKFGSEKPMELNNALLGLYAQTLYQQLIQPKHVDPKDYCLRVATNLLTPEASNLYISTFPEDELVYMNNTIHRLFEELKQTLKSKVEKLEWTEGDRESLIAKIDNLKVVTPDISYFGHNESVYGSMKVDKLTDNYFNNSITLMKRYRKRMYTQFGYNPGDPEQIWTYYTTPFHSKGLVVYELDLVVIPFGAIDWSIKYNEWSIKYNSSFDYITFATIGNTIAHQIAHHFDANGIFYRSGSRHNTLIFDGMTTNSTFVEYINCQQNVLYEKPLTMTLPSTEQTVSYRISQLTLNERLSETMGLRLAYDTLNESRSRAKVLPWLNLDLDQLFYLTYAQMHCTKLPLTSSYVSLYEDEHLPSRIRIFVSTSNNRPVGNAWECREGTGLLPSCSCDVFPYLHAEEMPESVPMSK